MLQEEKKKSCSNCLHKENTGIAFRGRRIEEYSVSNVGGEGEPFSGGFDSYRCGLDGSSINKNELDKKSCDFFEIKKKGMTLEQQLENAKQQKILEEKNRLEKEKLIEYNMLSNCLKKKWKFIVEFIGYRCHCNSDWTLPLTNPLVN